MEPKTYILYNKLAIALLTVLQGDDTWDQKPNPYLFFFEDKIIDHGRRYVNHEYTTTLFILYLIFYSFSLYIPRIKIENE